MAELGSAEMSERSGWPGLDASAARPAAIATGDLLAASREVARSIRQEAKRDRYEALELGLARMRETGLITSTEREQLSVLLDAVRESVGEEDVPHAVIQRVRSVYHTLLADYKSSTAAVAIASGVNNLFTPKPVERPDGAGMVVRVTVQEGAGTGAFIGGVVGALVGAAGGPGAAFAGAAVGVAVGGTVGASFTDED